MYFIQQRSYKSFVIINLRGMYTFCEFECSDNVFSWEKLPQFLLRVNALHCAFPLIIYVSILLIPQYESCKPEKNFYSLYSFFLTNPRLIKELKHKKVSLYKNYVKFLRYFKFFLAFRVYSNRWGISVSKEISSS